MISIVCTEDLVCGKEAFSTLGTVTVVPEGKLDPVCLQNADVLAIRSTSKIDASLISGSRLKFVGTATIGTDHMDIPAMEKQGIHWCSAPGCNARSVGEYWTAAMVELAQRHGFSMQGQVIGIVGHGNVGHQVEEKARILGMKVLLNDPPREAMGQTGYQSLDSLLHEADIVTLHVPLEKSGPLPTHHMADERFFKKMKAGSIFINAARGSLVDTPALLKAIQSGHIRHTIIDTWEGEPSISEELLKAVDLGTPHIAGHSYEGKVIGTLMVYKEACKLLNQPVRWDPAAHLQKDPQPFHLEGSFDSLQSLLHELVPPLYSIAKDDRMLREILAWEGSSRSDRFKSIRKKYPVRREFNFMELTLTPGLEKWADDLKRLGFRIKISSPRSHLKSGHPLTAEEQMALFEKDLKDNDCGHRPC